MIHQENNYNTIDISLNKKPQTSLWRLLFPPMAMATGAVALLLFQFYGTDQKSQENPPELTIARQPEIQIQQPEKPKTEPTKPKLPEVSAESLAAKRAELARVAGSIRPSQVLQSATTQKAIQILSSVIEASRERNFSGLTLQTAQSQTAAEAGTLESLKVRKEAIEKKIEQIATAPKPPRQALSGFSPVAKPAKGEEYHFEVIGTHVAFIDLEKLMEMVKKDFQVRVRLSGSPRGIRSEVGPVGDFGLAYEIGPAIDPISGATGFGMKGWEVIPASESRGETVEQAAEPLSNFQRVIHRLAPGQATITMWVYPSGFETFRRLRDQLHAQGYMVAARPLPEGVPVRGSPSGSLSAGQ